MKKKVAIKEVEKEVKKELNENMPFFKNWHIEKLKELLPASPNKWHVDRYYPDSQVFIDYIQKREKDFFDLKINAMKKLGLNYKVVVL